MLAVEKHGSQIFRDFLVFLDAFGASLRWQGQTGRKLRCQLCYSVIPGPYSTASPLNLGFWCRRIVEVFSILWCSSSVPTSVLLSVTIFIYRFYSLNRTPSGSVSTCQISHGWPSDHHGQPRFWFLEAPSPIRKLQMSRQDRWDHSHWTKLSSFFGGMVSNPFA